MEKYTNNPKHVYYDKQTKGIATPCTKKEDLIIFDSISEYKLYLFLESFYEFKIECHQEISCDSITWCIDFKICSYYQTGTKLLANICNACNKTEFKSLNNLFIEYKGVQNKSFLKKMGYLMNHSPMFSKSLILVSSITCAFGCDDEMNDNNTLIKPIVGIDRFKRIVTGIVKKNILG